MHSDTVTNTDWLLTYCSRVRHV